MEGAPWADVAANARRLIEAAPDRCIWGTDWPYLHVVPAPGVRQLLDALVAWAPNDGQRRRILVDNPARLYGFA